MVWRRVDELVPVSVNQVVTGGIWGLGATWTCSGALLVPGTFQKTKIVPAVVAAFFICDLSSFVRNLLKDQNIFESNFFILGTESLQIRVRSERRYIIFLYIT